MQIGCCVKSEQAILAKKAGYDFVELSAMELSVMSDSDFLSLKQLLRDLSLPVHALNMYCNESIFDVNAAIDPETVTAYAELICGRAEKLGVHFIGIGCPSCRTRSVQTEPELAITRFFEFCRLTENVAAKYCISVLIEPVQDRMCNIINYAAEGVSAIKQLNCENIHLLIDFCHAEIMMEDEAAIISAIPYASHVHVGHIDHESSRRDYLRERDQENINSTIKMLVSANYEGAISMEASGPGDPLECLRDSCMLLRHSLAENQM